MAIMIVKIKMMVVINKINLIVDNFDGGGDDGSDVDSNGVDDGTVMMVTVMRWMVVIMKMSLLNLVLVIATAK